MQRRAPGIVYCALSSASDKLKESLQRFQGETLRKLEEVIKSDNEREEAGAANCQVKIVD